MELNLKKIDSNSTLFSSLMNSLLLLKGFLLKITLIALIIKIFKKYSIFRKLWTFFSFTLYSIFGISLIDIYEIEILSKFLNNILDVFTKFNASILELFSKKVEIPQVENKSGFASLMESIRSRGKGKNVINTSSQPIASGSSTVIETQPVVTASSTVIENKPKLDSLLEQINARRNDRDVVASPNISNVGLQTPIQDRLNTSPIPHKSSFTNLFEDTMNLFDDPIDTGIDTSGSSSNVEITNNSANLVALIDSLDKVKVDIDVNNHKLNFNFGGLEDKIKSIHTATNDGYTANFDFKGSNSYSWDNRSDLNQYSLGCRIKDIFIIDKEGKTYNIYHKDPIIK
jgi:hypothetical protein